MVQHFYTGVEFQVVSISQMSIVSPRIVPVVEPLTCRETNCVTCMPFTSSQSRLTHDYSYSLNSASGWPKSCAALFFPSRLNCTDVDKLPLQLWPVLNEVMPAFAASGELLNELGHAAAVLNHLKESTRAIQVTGDQIMLSSTMLIQITYVSLLNLPCSNRRQGMKDFQPQKMFRDFCYGHYSGWL